MFKIELLSETAKAPTKVGNCHGMIWNLFADSFYHAGMQDVKFDLDKTFYGSKLNGRATKDGYILHPRGRILVRAGLSIELPKEYKKYIAEIVPIYRYHTTSTDLDSKGLLIERKIIIEDGEIDFVAVNLGHRPIEIKKGESIAHIMFNPVWCLSARVQVISRYGGN